MAKKIFVLLLGFSLALMSPVLADPVQWSANNHWYEAQYTPSGINWSDAYAGALARGGYLATATSADENTFIFNLVSDPKYWFIDGVGNVEGPRLGGYQYDNLAEPSGHWTWVTGEEWSYTHWATGEPNNLNGYEHSVVFFNNQGLKPPASTWNDVNYATLTYGYVIEWDTNPVPVPGAIWLLGSGLLGLLAWKRRS